MQVCDVQKGLLIHVVLYGYYLKRGSSFPKCSSSDWVLFPCFSNERLKNKNLLFHRENRIVGLIKGSGPEEKAGAVSKLFLNDLGRIFSIT